MSRMEADYRAAWRALFDQQYTPADLEALYEDEPLSVLREALDALASERAAREKAEAECGAMREALVEARALIAMDKDAGSRECVVQIDAALSGTAGRALRARLEAAERLARGEEREPERP